jgi:hypothetical protein
MKLRTALVVLVVAAMAAVASADLLNGDFETQGSASDLAADWTRFGSWANWHNDWLSPAPHSGSGLVAWHYWQSGTDGNAGWYQELTGLTDGGTYDFSVYAMRDATYSGGDVNIKVEPFGGGSAILLDTYTMTDIGTDWTLINVTGKLGSGVTSARFTIEPTAGTGDRIGAIKFDDASLTEQAIPEPATAALMGLSLIAIMAMRRRAKA